MEKVVPTLTIQFESDEQLELVAKWLIGDELMTEEENEVVLHVLRNIRRPNTDEAFLEVVQSPIASVS